MKTIDESSLDDILHTIKMHCPKEIEKEFRQQINRFCFGWDGAISSIKSEDLIESGWKIKKLQTQLDLLSSLHDYYILISVLHTFIGE